MSDVIVFSEIEEEQNLSPRDLLYRAVKYVLDRIQTDADLGYQAGFGCEVFRRLCVAEAAHLDKPFKDIETERAEQFWRREPRVLELKQRVEELEAGR